MNSNNKKKIPKRIIVTACVIFGITFAGKTLAYSNEVMASRNSDPNMDWYKNYCYCLCYIWNCICWWNFKL